MAPLRRLLKQLRAMPRGSDPNKLAILTILSILFCFAQWVMGAVNRDVGLLSSGCHSAFDVAALFMCLYAMLHSSGVDSFAYTFGMARLEVLVGFVNAVFLIFVALFSIVESFHALVHRGEHHAGCFPFFVSMGFAVDCFGIFAFRRHARIRSVLAPVRRAVDLAQKPLETAVLCGRAANLHGLFLHCFVDAFTRVGFVVALLLQRHYDNRVFFAVVSCTVSVFIAFAVWPLFRFTSKVLLQTTPEAGFGGAALQKCMREVHALTGVIECRQQHWWCLTPSVIVGTLCLRARPESDAQAILLHVQRLFRRHVAHLTVQIEKDAPIAWALDAHS